VWTPQRRSLQAQPIMQRSTHLVEGPQPVEQRPILAILQHELQLAVDTVAHTVHRHQVRVRLDGDGDLHLTQHRVHCLRRRALGDFDCDGLPVPLALPHLTEEPAGDAAHP
jgi:hypothetical protein